MTEEPRIDLEKLDEAAKRKFGELKKASSDASAHLRDDFRKLRGRGKKVFRRLEEGGPRVGEKAKQGWSTLLDRVKKTQEGVQESWEKRKK